MTAIAAWPGRAENWLDDRGRGAWIAAMILGFIVFWPIGLALLAYMIWGKKMFGKSCRNHSHHHRAAWATHNSSGNAAFDAYKSDMLKRLEDEQTAFADFLNGFADGCPNAAEDQLVELAHQGCVHHTPIKRA